jgi:hypothetical protein
LRKTIRFLIRYNGQNKDCLDPKHHARRCWSEKRGIQEDERVDGSTKFSSEPALVQLGLVNEEGEEE